MTMKVKTLSFHAIAYRLTMKLCSDESSLERQHIEYLQQTFQQKQQQVWPPGLRPCLWPLQSGPYCSARATCRLAMGHTMHGP